MADQRDDYRDFDARPPWVARFWTRRRIVVVVAGMCAGAVVLFWLSQHKTDRHYSTYLSIMDAESLARASFYKNKRDGRFPTQLSVVRSGSDIAEHRLIDPWGKPYRYAVVPNEAGELEPYVWTERIDANGQATMIGAKVRPDGTVVRFGSADGD
jgi:hypothetical protein